MAKKQQSLEEKLGSWTIQAALTRNQPDNTDKAMSKKAARKTYHINRGLMDRVGDLAQELEVSEQEVIGRLLTWALDQVASGDAKIV